MVEIIRVSDSSSDLLDGINYLLPQLDTNTPLMSTGDLDVLLSGGASNMLVAKHDEKICGMITVVCYDSPTGRKARIEDLVIDNSARGLGAGRALLEAGIELAREIGATALELTSRPSRIAANKLYQTSGFELRETNVYRMNLK